MSTARATALLVWSLSLVLVGTFVGYSSQFWGLEPVWDFIHAHGHRCGWAGMLAMLLSLAIIPRKRQWLSRGTMRSWYRLHVVLGLVGPVLVTAHAYGKLYGVGALAFVSMWFVLVTGIVGHFIVRALPEELRHRLHDRDEMLRRLQQVEERVRESHDQARALRESLGTAEIFERLRASERLTVSRPSLLAAPGRMVSLLRELGAARADAAAMRGRIATQASLEVELARLRSAELLELLEVAGNARSLVILSEIYSIWRVVHVPVSWVMWWLVGVHLAAWVYY